MSPASCRPLQAGSLRSPEIRKTRETWTSRLAGRIAGRLSGGGAAIIERDRLDFDAGVFRQGGNADGRARGRVLREVGSVDFVHLLEIAEVGQEHSRFHDMGQGQLLRLQD